MRNQRSSNSSVIRTPLVGDRIRVVGNSHSNSYQPGVTYEVVRVDKNDSTLIAASPSGQEGGWISWTDIVYAAEIGWEWLQKVLPTEAIEILSAFDGLNGLILRHEVRSHILLRIPDLKNKILEAQVALENAGMQSED